MEKDMAQAIRQSNRIRDGRDLRSDLSSLRPGRGTLRDLAARVDAKMRAVAAQGRTVDSLRVAVLAALNLADELSQAGVADPRWAMRARPVCAGCWMKCWKRNARRVR